MKKITALLLIVMLATFTPALAKDCWYYAANGTHDYEQTNVMYADCTTDGYYMLECRQCGETEKHITEKAYGHDWEKTSVIEASCTDVGFTVYECKNCSQVMTKQADKLGHKYKRVRLVKEASCVSEGSELVSCSRCSSQVTRSTGYADHIYGEWTFIGIISDSSMNLRSRTCLICGKTQEENVYPEGTLYRGVSAKEAVRDMQQKLLDLGYLNSKVDGIFGKDTQRAVSAFATDEQLPADGVAWPPILEKLDRVWRGEPSEVPATTIESTVVPYCICDDTGAWTMCENHALLCQTVQALYQSAQSDASRLRVLRQVRTLWESELDALYEAWMTGADSEAQATILAHRAAFANYLTMQEAIWNRKFGATAPETMENVNKALEEQCLNLCALVAEDTENY